MGNSKNVTFSPFLTSHVCDLILASCLVHETSSLNFCWIYNPEKLLCCGLFYHKHIFLSSPQDKTETNSYTDDKYVFLCLVWRRNFLHHYQMLQKKKSGKISLNVLRENFQLSRKFHIRILWYIFEFPFLLKRRVKRSRENEYLSFLILLYTANT